MTGERGHFEDRVQPEVLQKLWRRRVQDWAARTIGAPGFQDQTLVQQALQHAVAVDAADGVDLRARDRLLVGDDRQGLESSTAQMGRRFQSQEALNQLGKLRGSG